MKTQLTTKMKCIYKRRNINLENQIHNRPDNKICLILSLLCSYVLTAFSVFPNDELADRVRARLGRRRRRRRGQRPL